MVPIDGELRENVGLLGSPCFEIPRVVDQDKSKGLPEEKLRQRIRAKNRFNLASMFWLLIGNWFFLFVALCTILVMVLYYPRYGWLTLLAAELFLAFFGIGWFAVMERGSIGFGRLKPMLVSMYDDRFWGHERHWKFCGSPLMSLFKGTPFKNVISRLLGVQLGHKVFDDGCRFHDKTLIEIGNYANLNEGCIFQGHSLEEGVFKCDGVKIGNGCSIGGAAFVHYGVTMGDDVVLAPDSFLMKGEILDPGSSWRGNPAKAARTVVIRQKEAAAPCRGDVATSSPAR
jgi:non-ribosomal peptide synthetase-like protein